MWSLFLITALLLGLSLVPRHEEPPHPFYDELGSIAASDSLPLERQDGHEMQGKTNKKKKKSGKKGRQGGGKKGSGERPMPVYNPLKPVDTE